MENTELQTTTDSQNPQDPIQGEAASTHLLPDATDHESMENGNTEPAVLPENVTVEPQHEEHANLETIGHDPSLRDVYLAVSDDAGQFIGDTDLDEQLRGFISEYKSKKSEEIENLDATLEELDSLYQRYTSRINRLDAISEGVLTKYRIRVGMLLIIEKRLMKQSGTEWVAHFTDKYGKNRLRSAQDYMKLARIPNIIRYAVYGKERLLEIVRAIKEMDIRTEDPVATFLSEYSINYNPEELQSEESLAQLKIEIDAAIFMTKLKKIDEDESRQFNVSVELIKGVIATGKKVDKGLIHNMTIIRDSGGDVNRYLEQLYLNGGHENTLVKVTKGVENLPKLVIGLGNLVGYLRIHTQVLERVSPSSVEALEQHVTELKNLLTQADNNQ